MEKTYEYRIYPNTEQEELLLKTFGCCRFVYNHVLAIRQEEYETTAGFRSINSFITQIPIWKKTDAPWLSEVDSMALQQSLRDLDKAYRNFFRAPGKVGFPKFKSRRSRQSYRTNIITIPDDHHVRLPKLGLVKARISRPIEGRILSATVKQVPSGKFFVTVCCTDVPERKLPESAGEIGIDLGVRKKITTSEGEVFENTKPAYRYGKKLRREQRRLSRKQGARKGEAKSNNFRKQQLKVARIHEKVANTRKDATHKATTQLINENQVLVAETLNVRGMMANHHCARVVADVSPYEVVRQLAYKADWHGRVFIQVGMWYPSSQLCSVCGHREPKVKDLREKWVCPVCGTHHDRDINAARNILAEGKRILEGTVGHTGTAA